MTKGATKAPDGSVAPHRDGGKPEPETAQGGEHEIKVVRHGPEDGPEAVHLVKAEQKDGRGDDKKGDHEKGEKKGDEKGDGVGEKYWTIKLVHPPGAAPAVTAYIALAEAAIQTAVDLLGRGMPTPPPKLDDLLTSVVHDNLGKGESTKLYQETLAKVQARQTSLLIMDKQVLDTSIVMAAEQDQTLRAILDVVDLLNTRLEAFGKGDLKPAQEAKILDHVAAAVEKVYDKVTAVAELSSKMAGSGNEGNSDGKNTSGTATHTGTGQGSAQGTTQGVVPAAMGGAGAGGGLMSLLPVLAMLPMAIAPLAAQLPELLENLKEKEEEDEDDSEEEIPPGQPAPPPTDPTAPPAGTAAPQNTQPAPTPPANEPQNPQETPQNAPQAQV
ncbi:hypothetical protein [Nocardia paucivorans]|uniref:hypothetical protein n=1 Tax=Nocardia paucivorans TaxID=114259 RepID=UPI0012F71466|nr:hypothetical protein [Nocardia paucivorans]